MGTNQSTNSLVTLTPLRSLWAEPTNATHIALRSYEALQSIALKSLKTLRALESSFTSNALEAD